MDSKFVGPNGPDNDKILKEGGKILTGDPDKQSGGKYIILTHCTKGDANNCRTVARKLGDAVVKKPPPIPAKPAYLANIVPVIREAESRRLNTHIKPFYNEKGKASTSLRKYFNNNLVPPRHSLHRALRAFEVDIAATFEKQIHVGITSFFDGIENKGSFELVHRVDICTSLE
ncbi:unnamed protein product [Clonostachys rosea]|uniref:Uncharacterized protein n=1 Tax=Bionectria ochroleuca TaxID=29856 RepID=A0ABY6TZ86_BIOOC|nr:unnamed protein product [Clonostachys rosea]